MPLSRTERFSLKSGLLDVINDDRDWDWRRTNVLLGEFGLELLDQNGSPLEEILAGVSDPALMEMYSIVTGVELKEVESAVDSAESGNWKRGYVKLFLSHSAVHKKFLGEVADELAVVGIHGFVAHDTMEVSKPWQDQIEQALRSMQAFVAVVHPEFNDSPWCHQEVGWALGRRVPRYVIRMGTDPRGFIGREQWPSAYGASAKDVAREIAAWVSSNPELGETMVDGLFAALESAGNYMTAGATADRVASLADLTIEQWSRLDRIYWSNDQLYTGALPTRALAPFYRDHGRPWPPPNVASHTSSAPMLGTGAESPF